MFQDLFGILKAGGFCFHTIRDADAMFSPKQTWDACHGCWKEFTGKQLKECNDHCGDCGERFCKGCLMSLNDGSKICDDCRDQLERDMLDDFTGPVPDEYEVCLHFYYK